MATALVIGNMIGSGVFLLPASPALTGVGAMTLPLVFARWDPVIRTAE
jgi:hypothetical protein